MAQFYTLDEAAARLGIPADEFKRKLKTEWTTIRPFRDGPTLRFRTADIDELARSLGAASDPGLALGPVGAAPAEAGDDAVPITSKKQSADAPLDLGGDDDIFSLTKSAPGKLEPKKSDSDSDVRLDLHTKKGYDAESAHPTEEIALDLSGPGSSAILKAGSGKLSASKSGTKLAGPESPKIPSPTSKPTGGGKAPDSSSEFELSLDAESDSFELQLTSDSSEEVDLGSAAPAPKTGGASGINLGKPADSGVSLEKKGSKPASKKTDSDSDLDFELSLDPGGASGTRLSGPKSTKHSKGADSSSEFELTLDDNSGVVDNLADSLNKPDESKGDIFETDFELPVMDDSGSEIVAIGDADDSGSSEFEVDITDADVPVEDESASQVMLVDEDSVALDDVAVDDDEPTASSALRGVRRGDDDDYVGSAPVQTIVQTPPKWGILPAMVLFPTLLLVFLGGLMSFEVVRGMWGYHQPSRPGNMLVRGVADTFGMKTND